MPPITVTLTETEATHIRELIENDKAASEGAIQLFPEKSAVNHLHETMIELDAGLLEKFKDV